jgi:hypothetical protein
MSLFVADLGIKGFEDKLPEKFLQDWNKLNLIYGSSRLAYELPGLIRSLKGLEPNILSSKRLSPQQEQQFRRLLSKLDEMEGSLPRVIDLAGISASGLIREGVELSGITYNQLDDCLDVIVHSEMAGYRVWIDKLSYPVDETGLANILLL